MLRKMRLLKIVLVSALCCVLLFSAAALGADEAPEPPPDGDMTLEEALLTLVNQINALQTRVYTLEAQLGALQGSLSPAETDDELLDLQITQSRETEKYLFLTEYYAAALMMKQGSLYARRLSVTDKQIVVEKVKAELGESAPGNVETLIAQRESLSRQSESNRKSWELKKLLLDTKYGERGYEFIGNYDIPEPSEFTMSPDKLQDALLQKNATLRSYDNQLDALNDTLEEMRNAYGFAYDAYSIESEIRTLSAQRELYERQLRWTALGKYAAYTDALAAFGAHSARRPLLDEQLARMRELYAAGELSELEYMSRELSVYEELYEADAAAVALTRSARELSLLSEGVVAG